MSSGYRNAQTTVGALVEPLPDLTGTWTADDGAIYYIRHLPDNRIFWAGLHGYWEFHPGVAFTNVFRGVIDPTSRSIDGVWADVPRGGTLQNGRLRLDIVDTAPPPEPIIGALARPRIPPGDGPPPGPPPQARFELRKNADGTTGGFGASVWQKQRVLPPIPLEFRFDNVK